MPDQTKAPDEKIAAEEQEWTRKFAAAATGAQNTVLQHYRIAQVMSTMSRENGDHHTAGKAATQALAAIGPRNELEGMLATQMVSIHNATMQCLEHAALGKVNAEASRDLRDAMKLTHSFTRLIDTMTKLRSSNEFLNYRTLDLKEMPKSLRKGSE